MPLIAAIALACPSKAMAVSADVPDLVIHARTDTAKVTMGDRTALSIEVLKNVHEGALIGMPTPGPNQVLTFGSAEVRSMTVDSADLGHGRTQLNYKLVLQPFEPGSLTLPAFKYASQGDTASSEVLTIKVEEPEMPQEMRDSLWINPMQGTVSVPGRWYDVIPNWWPWALVALGVIALLVAVLMLYKKNGPSLLPRKKVIPPYILATRRLKELKERKLAENGHEKEFYTELTDILRQYLEGRFHIYAREMTSSQIIEAMNAEARTAGFTDGMRPLFETADFVKFAKQRPLPDENIRSYNIVQNFVDATKPTEEEENLAKGTSKKKRPKKARKAKRKK